VPSVAVARAQLLTVGECSGTPIACARGRCCWGQHAREPAISWCRDGCACVLLCCADGNRYRDRTAQTLFIACWMAFPAHPLATPARHIPGGGALRQLNPSIARSPSSKPCMPTSVQRSNHGMRMHRDISSSRAVQPAPAQGSRLADRPQSFVASVTPTCTHVKAASEQAQSLRRVVSAHVFPSVQERPSIAAVISAIHLQQHSP
jgi:hypothetical protein